MSVYIIDGRYYSTVSHCKWCGGHDLPEHSKYKGQCIDCGRRYGSYSTGRSNRRRNKLSVKAAQRHLKHCEEYILLRESGFHVPKAIDEELKATEDYINEILQTMRTNTVRGALPFVYDEE